MSFEQNDSTGPGTMHGLESAPITPRMQARDKFIGVPPGRVDNPNPPVPHASWAEFEQPDGAPQTPGIQTLIERDKAFNAMTPPGRQGAAEQQAMQRQMDRQGPPPRAA